MDEAAAVAAIKDYENYILESCYSPWKFNFQEISYAIWAVHELIDRVQTDFRDPMTVVEDFLQKTEMFGRLNPETSNIFYTAHEVAINVYDVLNAMQWK